MLPPGNIFRDHGLAALETIGRTWRFACVSESLGGLQAAVFAGIAVSVVAESSVLPGMRILGRRESFPPLPKVDLVLYRSARRNAAAEMLGDFIVRHFTSSALAPASRIARTQAGSGSHE